MKEVDSQTYVWRRIQAQLLCRRIWDTSKIISPRSSLKCECLMSIRQLQGDGPIWQLFEGTLYQNQMPNRCLSKSFSPNSTCGKTLGSSSFAYSFDGKISRGVSCWGITGKKKHAFSSYKLILIDHASGNEDDTKLQWRGRYRCFEDDEYNFRIEGAVTDHSYLALFCRPLAYFSKSWSISVTQMFESDRLILDTDLLGYKQQSRLSSPNLFHYWSHSETTYCTRPQYPRSSQQQRDQIWSQRQNPCHCVLL